MKRALLITVMIMAGILLCGEDIVVKNAFYGKINPKKATHDYEIIEHKHFEKKIAEAKLTRPTLTSAGYLAAARFENDVSNADILFDNNLCELMRLDKFHFISKFGNVVGKYNNNILEILKRENGKYILKHTIDRSNFRYPSILSDNGILLIEDDHDIKDEITFYVSFYDPASKRMATVDYFGLLGEPYTEGYWCDRYVVYVDDQRIVYSYDPSRKAGPLGTGNCGLAIFNFNGELLELVDLPIVESIGVDVSRMAENSLSPDLKTGMMKEDTITQTT